MSWVVDNPIRSRKMKIKLPWEISTLYSEHLGGINGEEREEEDDDDIEAHEDSLQRLKVCVQSKSGNQCAHICTGRR